ncbi:MAG TPA: hypothetical protein VGU67_02910 [Edaphobacter sp.]|nr:hypothetical protein [Edaphobacter sp.]
MTDESWRNWSLESEGLRWRIALEKDLPALTRLLDVAHSMMGAQERPDFFAFPVVLTLVAENVDGIIVDGLYIEFEAYIRKIGLNRQGMLSAETLVPMLGSFLVSRKVRIGRVAVPARLSRVMRDSMRRMGLIDVSQSFSHWCMKLRP